ncbi:MAG: DNA polymerase Y family protein [Proteobacteria bacterium]|nr:DNA polymerase Y family protein [Pseudomonadota bacterium]
MPAGPRAAPRRYLALWCPFLSTDRARRISGPGRDERPFVLVEKAKGALRIGAVDAKAAGLGLRLGMMLTQARALVPGVMTEEADLAADAHLLHILAEACEIFTPLVALRGQDGVILDISGCAHLFGGERALGQAARRRMQMIGVQTQAAIAGTPEAAWAFARFRHGTLARPEAEEALARSLPISALDQETGTTLALQRAGFKTLDDLARRPSHSLSARFGKTLVEALRRVLGQEDIRITPLRPLPAVMAERQFAEPLGLKETVLATLERLAGDVMATLEARGEGGRTFEASFFRTDNTVRRILIETAQATRETASLMRLVRLKIEALTDPLDPGFGFDALRLAVLHVEPLGEAQPHLDDERRVAEGARDLTDLVNRLVARFGRENVQRFVSCDTHDPALAGGTAAWLSSAPTPWPAPVPEEPPARPFTLFAHPQPIDVLAEVPDSPPLRFRWRRVLHEVTLAEGPERIAPEWWREASPAPDTRDYYRVEDANGHRFWIFREGFYEDTTARPRWFMHGLFA